MSGAQATFVLTAGGTGGHLFPAQALAETLLRRGHRLVLMTDARGAAYADRFPGAEVVTLSSASPSGNLIRKVAAAWKLLRGGFAALGHLRRIAPAAVIGFGGYASFPALWAADRQRLPIVLHEQNAHLGRANRMFADRAGHIALSFADTNAVPGSIPTELTGNPVRDAISAVRQRVYEAPSHDGSINLLIFGGSLGASIFADVVPEAIGQLPEKLRNRVVVIQQVREAEIESVRAAYADHGIQAELATFFDNMDELLSGTHLVLARAGASTCTELMVAGRPSILVPYPHAADDHQTANAKTLTEAGAAWLVPNEKFDAATCSRSLAALLEDPATLTIMAASAHAIAMPDAAERLADLAEQAGGVA
jgi:UDP-N-acetylglucosamine--N-acetylmuramyl-(pentapeptide) pyrophosphoryl-undecaprenol N-acetylglucosamine transferase